MRTNLETGQRFGRLVVLQDAGWAKITLRCDCGKDRVSTRNNLRLGHTQSCGCLKREQLQAKHDQRWYDNVPLVGARFGRLVVLRHARPWTFCQCDCGQECHVPKYSLTNGRTQSCGCLRQETARKKGKNVKHGGWGTVLWDRWHGMIRRCTDPSAVGYDRYGGQGVIVDPRWLGDTGFQNFRDDVGEPPSKKHTLDRINGAGNYQPGNVRWATPTEQARNRKTNHLVVAFGRTQCLSAWAEEVGLSSTYLRHQLKKGLSPEQVLQRAGSDGWSQAGGLPSCTWGSGPP